MSVETVRQGMAFRETLRMRVCEPYDACSQCGESIQGVCVAWHGHDGLLVLHPHCAYDLAHDLIGDAQNAIRLIEGKPLNRGVNVEPGALER